MKAAPAEKLTYADFLRFPDDGLRHELIDGEHYVTPSSATVHQRLVGRLHIALARYLEAHPIGEVFLAPLDVVLSVHDIVEPDLFVVLQDQVDIVCEPHVAGAPALVVEILSPGTRRRDEGIKRRLYDRVGVREYWLIDPAVSTVVAHRRQPPGGLTAEPPIGLEDALASPLLPGFSLPLRDLFARPPFTESRG
jgi:Uma2 family endonuclease